MCILPLPEHKPWNGNAPDVHLCWDGDMWAPSNYGDIDRKAVDKRKLTAFKQGQKRRADFLELITEGISVKDACAGVGVTVSAYSKWRRKYPRFAAEVDLARDIMPADRMEYTGGFATFRRLYLGMETTWFQQEFVNALESCEPGEIILVLWPPEHGKTTTIEDFCNYKLALEPQTRITIASEKQSHGVKVIKRVKHRMDPEGPTPLYVAKFGPFVPEEADGRKVVTRQPWASTHFDVRQRGHFDERDYSMSAVGITTKVQSVRADWLLGDDLQCLRSLPQTEAYVDMLRQDFFSRPGILGRICLTGTRVGNMDIYEKLIDEGLIDKLLVFPAYKDVPDDTVPEGYRREWLWPQKYTPEQYAKMRHRVGESAWFRNFMQAPTMAKEATFTPEIVEPCFNPARAVFSDAPEHHDESGAVIPMPVAVCLDPALGSINSVTSLGFGRKQLHYLSSRIDTGFTRNEEIFDALEQEVIRWTQPGRSRVELVIIETMNFQKGLANDDRMIEMSNRYGFRVVPHLTGSNKYDENIGIASMALSFRRGEVDLPYSGPASHTEIDGFAAELYAWRPNKRGVRLRQDRVMSFWFGWIRWKAGLAMTKVNQEQFSSRPSPLRRSA